MSPHLAKGLHLHGTHKGHQRICHSVHALRQKAHHRQQNNLCQQNQLPPVHPLHVLKLPVNTLGHIGTRQKSQQRNQIMQALLRLSIKKIGAAQNDISGLRVGKYLPPAQIGIRILQSAGQHHKNRRQKSLGHLPPGLVGCRFHRGIPPFYKIHLIIRPIPPASQPPVLFSCTILLARAKRTAAASRCCPLCSLSVFSSAVCFSSSWQAIRRSAS